MIDTVLFDIDGVMLSEERYFDASALTVYEMVHSNQYLGISGQQVNVPNFSVALSMDEVSHIRSIVFHDDAVLNFMKQCGINANWDMVYLQTVYQLTRVLEWWSKRTSAKDVVDTLFPLISDGWCRDALKVIGESVRSLSGGEEAVDYKAFTNALHGCRSKEDLFEWLENKLQFILVRECSKVSVPRFDSNLVLWNVCQEAFQEWYLGDAYVEVTHQPGKTGFLRDELPLVPVDSLTELFRECIDKGITIGIGTGRPALETVVPFETFGWSAYFHPDRVSTATDVLTAEHMMPDSAPLSKPHPYCYLRSYLRSPHVSHVLSTPLPLSDQTGERILVVGDSVADFLAARSIGCRFAAVLTGLEGKGARAQFESLGADYIWNNVLGLRELIQKLP